jgi:hypothetical protein
MGRIDDSCSVFSELTPAFIYDVDVLDDNRPVAYTGPPQEIHRSIADKGASIGKQNRNRIPCMTGRIQDNPVNTN